MSVLGMGFGVLAIVSNVYGSGLSHRALWRLHMFVTLLAGLWLGMCIALSLAGQLFRRRAKQLQDSR